MTERIPIDRAEAQEILVRGPNWIGDLVMSTPGLRSLRAGFPEARITLQVRAGHESLLEGSRCVDRVIGLRSYHAGIPSLLGEALALRRESRGEGRPFDLGLCIPDSYSSALFMRLAGVRRTVGYARGARGLLLHDSIVPPASWGRRRMVARERFVLGLSEALGCPDLGTQLELQVTQESEEEARRLMEAGDVEAAGAPLVALAPGASFGPSKQWPVSSFAEVGDALASTGARVVLIGSEGEAALTAEVKKEMALPALDLAGALNLGSLKALIRKLSLLICNDAGARHIAVAFGVPCIVFFGPTSLAKTNLNLDGVQVLEKEFSCRPCYQRECPIDHRCMTSIEPTVVCDLALRTLEKPRPLLAPLPPSAPSHPSSMGYRGERHA